MLGVPGDLESTSQIAGQMVGLANFNLPLDWLTEYVERVNAVSVLPAYHVSGLMARVRCAMTGGTFVEANWKRIEAGERPEVPDL